MKAIGNRDLIPMAATSAIHEMRNLMDEISTNLNTDKIEQTSAVFNSNQSLCTIDVCLVDIVGKMMNYLDDVYQYLNLILLKKTENREDFSSVLDLMNNIDSVRERLVSVPFDIAEFHEKHKSKLGETSRSEPEQTVRKALIRGHKTWLQYQVAIITSSIQLVTRMYPLATSGKK